jgi:glycosyltransferase involved in cell wall biosynthesis
MHIAEIAPPWFPIPPIAYGGIERVVDDLTEGLVAAGHAVTLFAPAGSRTSARLVETGPAGVGLDLGDEEKQSHFLRNGRQAYAGAVQVGAELVHDHTDFTPDPAFPLPIVRTIHGPAVDSHVAMYAAMSARGDHFLAISARQRDLFRAAACALFGPGEHIRFAGVVHNPIDVASTPFYPAAVKEDYLVFLGRCHWEKDPVGAIQTARAAGLPLKLALRVTDQERPYFDAVVQPALRQAGDAVEFVGEVGGAAKAELIGRARAVLFSSPWEEPFGLVLTEAGAHGTPVVALRRGAAPEIVAEGVNGYLAADLDEMAALVPAAMRLDPVACRAHVAAHFDRPVIAQRLAVIFTDALTPSALSRDESQPARAHHQHALASHG